MKFNRRDVPMTCPTIGRIAAFLDKSREGLAAHTRWNHYRPKLAVRGETILEHTFDTVALAIIVCDALNFGTSAGTFDPYRVVACAAVHDVGEIVRGDIAYFKRDESDGRFERDVFSSLISGLPPSVAISLLEHFSVQFIATEDSSTTDVDRGTAQVFEFVERFGYLCFSIAETRRDPSLLPLLEQVAGRQLARLEQLLVRFPELEILFPNDEREAVRSLASV